MPKQSSAQKSDEAADDRLRTLGLLARRIAHQLNNLLTPVSASASLLESAYKTDSRQGKAPSRIAQSAKRATELVQNLNEYAHAGAPAPESVALNQLIRDLSETISIVVGEDTSVDFSYAESLPNVHVIPTHLQRVLLLLVTGSTESMAQRGGDARINISTGLANARKDGLNPLTFEYDRNDELPYLKVADSGMALEVDSRDQVLHIFTSEKPNARTLGLLAACEFAIEHAGTVKFGGGRDGCTIRIYFAPPRPTEPSDSGE